MPTDKKPKAFPFRRLVACGIAILAIRLAILGIRLATHASTHSASAGAPKQTLETLLPRALPPPPPTEQRVPEYAVYELETATVHVVSVYPSTPIAVVAADELATVEAFAQQHHAVVALNGGFFDPQNGQTTSHLIIAGQPAGDPADNERLTANSSLQQYLPQILNRSEFRTYRCQGLETLRYDITSHNAPIPDNCAIESALGAGPQILPENTALAEGFIDYQNGALVRDAIGIVQPNARSAIALRPDGTVLLLMAAQRIESAGMTLAELGEFATSLGATQLLNLDGGSSSSLYYNGQTYAGRLDEEGKAIQRPVKSVLVIGQKE
ncbi:MAG: phosphodiester glycosidase family protein [Phormidesmis sp. RL_2_1]|nr:phosphodiester glycosidase family protein [Phormidesmis sp. RL_2_1]